MAGRGRPSGRIVFCSLNEIVIFLCLGLISGLDCALEYPFYVGLGTGYYWQAYQLGHVVTVEFLHLCLDLAHETESALDNKQHFLVAVDLALPEIGGLHSLDQIDAGSQFGLNKSVCNFLAFLPAASGDVADNKLGCTCLVHFGEGLG